ncbi:MAG: right-handed parallel beta-helix repeat-containing protein, partial [Candidatus Bathyarchaeota archaeon]|nr:right-handed parallel beta-helix repeat-containing protein [Candidatus Bathyarchaeota archaeon]
MVKYTRLLIKRIKVLKLKAIAATALLLMLMAIFMMKPGVAFPTKVYVNPPAIVDPTMVPGTTFSIAVTVDLVEELWGYQIEMVFDPEVLHGVDYADGPFLGSAGGNVIFVPGMGFDNEIGKLYLFSAALFPKVDFPTGGGPLAFFTFEVVGTGTSPLQFGYDSGLLNKTGGFDLGPDWEPIHKVENPDVFIDGYFDNRLAVAVDPPEVSGTWVGESFTVNITAPNIEDVYAWSFYLNWNATMLNATNVVEGDLLKGQPDGTDFYESISNDDGYLYANATTIGSYPGVSGGGTMATVTFEVEDVGNTTLHLYDVLMWNSTLNIIDVITADGWFTNLVRVLNLDTGIYYATIQSAIDAAETLDGHTILVTAGNYFENVILSKSLTLVGEDPYSTIIDAGGNAVAVDVWADDTTIDGFTIRNANEDGILVYDYHNSTIIGNFIMDCTWDGISLMYSNNNTIENNVFIEHAEWGGLYLQYSDGNTIENNVFIENGDYGLYIESSNNNLIYGNTISLTLGISLELWDTQGNMIVGNTISNSGSVAVELDVSNDTVFHNNFLDNAEQVWDWGTDTTWDNGSEGNYWSDYGGEDTDGDGIGDTLIPHQDVDNFPVMTPWPMGWDIV